jgi:hypothetical protein
MTTPFPFVAGAVLTAAELNAITTLPINDQTASYTLVVGDVGKRVVMNVASANTVTVDDSIFGVGDTIFIANKGAGATTVTAGAGVTINSASGLALVQNQGGQLIALSASSFLFVASAGPAPTSGLALVKTQTIGTTVASVTVTGAFSATYDNYLITVDGGVGSTVQGMSFQLGSTTTGYYRGNTGIIYSSGAVNANNQNNAASYTCGLSTSNQNNLSLFVFGPNTAKRTTFAEFGLDARTNGASGFSAGFEDSNTQHTAFTLAVGGTMTGGEIRVYGYANS